MEWVAFLVLPDNRVWHAQEASGEWARRGWEAGSLGGSSLNWVLRGCVAQEDLVITAFCNKRIYFIFL